MANGQDRYDVKAQAGWSRTRQDGSAYSRTTDIEAEAAEAWFAEEYGGTHNDSVDLKADPGFDVVLDRKGVLLKVDVIHAGRTREGEPRAAAGSSLIVNMDNNKLVRSDVLVYVIGPPFKAVGWIYTAAFLGLATVKDHGYGPKLSLSFERLWSMQLFGVKPIPLDI